MNYPGKIEQYNAFDISIQIFYFPIRVYTQDQRMKNTAQNKHSDNIQKRQVGESSHDYKPRKILPHINQQYEFRITNRILIQKIIHPRRDKTIIDSLTNTSCSNLGKKKLSNANQQSLINFRRKLINNSSMKKSQLLKPNNELEKPQYCGKKLNSRCSQKLQEGQSETRQKGLQLSNFDKIDGLAESKFAETQPTSLRDNFIGKIVRNISSRKQLSKRKNNLSNICDNFLSSSLLYFDNQIIDKQAKWNCSKPFKKNRQQMVKIYSKDASQKQNHDELVCEQL